MEQKVSNSIDFDYIKSLFELKSKDNLVEYLIRVYPDFYTKDKTSGKILGVSKVKFIDFIKLPIFICEKFFFSINKNQSEYISLEELTYSLCQLYFGTLEETAKVIFNIYDFDHDGRINPDDILAILSFLPLKEDKTKISYKYQLESIDELKQILAQTFQGKSNLNFDEFGDAIKYKSDVFLQLLCYFYQRCSFSEENLKIASRGSSANSSKKSMPMVFNNSTGTASKTQKHLPIVSIYSSENVVKSMRKPPRHHSDKHKRMNNFISTPNIKTNLSSVRDFITDSLNTLLEHREKRKRGNNKKKTFNPQSYVLSGLEGVVNLGKMRLDKKYKTLKINSNSKEILCPRYKKYSHKNTAKLVNDNFIKNLINDENIKNKQSVTVRKSIIEIVDFPDVDRDEFSSDADSDDNLDKKISIEGQVLKWSESKKSAKEYWLVLIGHDLFYYQSEEKKEIIKMNNILGCFIKENEDVTYKSIKYKSFSIIFRNKTCKYMVKSLQEGLDWVSNLRQALDYKNLFDSYEMLDDIGSGSYGTIKLGVQLKTKTKVAIKIIKKTSLSKEELSLVATEIDVLKFCKHPNIINFLDHYENSEYIFIVLEYIKFGDLSSYLKKFKKEKKLIPEDHASLIAYQIAEGLNYLHKFGIVHRDLKVENIMISKFENNRIVEIKILDFGLSKIIGPKETSGERYGTLYYISPEIALDKPHNRSTDIWSFGVLLFYILALEFPFDDESKQKKTIAKKIVNDPIEFPIKKWKERSREVIDLLTKCLYKDMDERISIGDILKSNWFKKYINK